jgi:DNA polymerase-3 subunit gamma/tau
MQLSFYRKYRPQSFRELVGQDHIKETLSSQVKSGRIAQAYLFCGTRGTGKTTTARILAKAINCQKQKNGEPCNRCVLCRDFTEGRNLDLVEIDAASNRGIDEIREIIEKVKFAPNQAKYKVFVIDEAHMLTREAFNALLKTLEEPPSHAIFILATTEPQRLPLTILSRVQRFDFKRVAPADIAKRLNMISRKEKLKIDDDVISVICETADGSFRDAESLLDQVASYVGKRIKMADLELILGISDQKSIVKLIDHLINNDPKSAILLINDLITGGHDLAFFNKNLIEYLRKLLLIKTGAVTGREIFIDFQKPEERVKKLSSQKILKLIKTFIETGRDIKNSVLPQLPLELAVIDLTDAGSFKTAVIQQVEISEKEEPLPILKKVTNKIAQNAAQVAQATKKIVKTNIKKANVDQMISIWPKLLSRAGRINHSLATLLRSSVPVEMKNDTIRLAVHFKFHQDQILSVKRRKIISELLKKITGRDYQLDCVLADEVDQAVIDNIKKKMQKVDRKTEEDLFKSVTEVFGT